MLLSRPSRVLAGAVTLALVAIACTGPRTKATRTNFLNTYSLYALTGAPVNTPSAISFLGGSAIANSAFTFDVALDIDSLGTTRVYPVRLLAGSLASAVAAAPIKRVGMQPVSGGFDALREAPSSGYDTLSAQVVTTGSVLALELQETANCLYDLGGTNLYAKLVIDSIRTRDRRIFARSIVDPNCGFRELMPDSIPER